MKDRRDRGDRGNIEALLRHWRDAVPEDRLAHLIRDVARAQMRALQPRIAEHGVSFGYWSFLRILWLQDGLTQRELSELAGVMEPTVMVVGTTPEDERDLGVEGGGSRS
jgi:hypothetical protein